MRPEFLYAGKAILTVESSLSAHRDHGHKPHYTYRVDKNKKGRGWFVSFMVGQDNTGKDSYRYLAMLESDGEVRFTAGSRWSPSSQIARVFCRAVLAIHGGRATLEVVENAGWKIHHAGFCGRCGKLLTNPASIETGIGPECETFVRLGIAAEDVPCVDTRGRLVARLQYAYWMNGDDGVILSAIADACEDAFGWDRERCELFATATRKLMRRHKKGAKLPQRFLDIVNF